MRLNLNLKGLARWQTGHGLGQLHQGLMVSGAQLEMNDLLCQALIERLGARGATGT